MGKASRRKAVLRAGEKVRAAVGEPAAGVEPEVSWAKIVETAREVEEEWLADGSMAWYRGHADEAWELKSTLHRSVEGFFALWKLPPPLTEQVDMLHAEYKKDYRRFRSRAWPLLDQREREDWGIVFSMQHYGQVTRLLDWTESLACAAYFALARSCEKCHDEGKSAAIWMLDPQALNRESQGEGVDGLIGLDEQVHRADGTVFDARPWHPRYKADPNEVLRTIAIAPDFTNPRLTAQRGAFTMSGDSFEPLNTELPGLASSKRLRKFVLTPAAKEDAAAFLASSGLDAYSFFPDLHGLAVRRKDEERKRLKLMRKVYGQALK